MADDAKTFGTGGALEIVLTVVPIILGSVSSYFNLFVENRKEFRSRVSLTRQTLLERVNERLGVLLDYVRQMGTGDVLRGDGVSNPDLVSGFTREQLRAFSLLHRVLNIERFFHAGHSMLLVTTIGAVMVFIGAILASSWRLCFVYAAVGLVVLQLVTIATVYRYSRRLDELEDLG